jgi:hypothetical protein
LEFARPTPVYGGGSFFGGRNTVLHNLAAASLIIGIFSSTCAFGVGKGLASIMRPLTYGALALAVVLYLVSYFGNIA